MAVIIEFQFTCPHDCGGTCTNGRTLDALSDANDDGVLRIDLSLQVSQERFVCDTCEHEFFTGDWEDFAIDDEEGECDYEPIEDDGFERDPSGWRIDSTEWSPLTTRMVGNEETGYHTDYYLGDEQPTWQRANREGLNDGSDDFLIVEIQDNTFVRGITGADNRPLTWKRHDYEAAVAGINRCHGTQLRYEPRSEEDES